MTHSCHKSSFKQTNPHKYEKALLECGTALCVLVFLRIDCHACQDRVLYTPLCKISTGADSVLESGKVLCILICSARLEGSPTWLLAQLK